MGVWGLDMKFMFVAGSVVEVEVYLFIFSPMIETYYLEISILFIFFSPYISLSLEGHSIPRRET